MSPRRSFRFSRRQIIRGLLAITAFVLVSVWGIGVLVYYSIRDRR